jgi:hypothetical protein
MVMEKVIAPTDDSVGRASKTSTFTGSTTSLRAALYSAAMEVREIAKFANQKAKPPATANIDVLSQISFELFIFASDEYRIARQANAHHIKNALEHVHLPATITNV